MNGRAVLTVGDEPTIQNHVTDLLQGLGYAPVTAGSVEEALAVLATARFDFSLVTMELGGTDGTDFLRRLKLQEAKELAAFALNCESAAEILARSQELARQIAPALFEENS